MRLNTQKDARDAIKKWGSVTEASRHTPYSDKFIANLADIKHWPSAEEQERFIEKHCGITAYKLCKRINRVKGVIALTWCGGVRMKETKKVRAEDKIVGYYDSRITPSQLKADLLWAVEEYLGKSLF